MRNIFKRKKVNAAEISDIDTDKEPKEPQDTPKPDDLTDIAENQPDPIEDAVTSPLPERMRPADAVNADVLKTAAVPEHGGDQPTFSISRAQTIGQRRKQEDAMCYSDWHDRKELDARGLLAVVADGIGGLKNGDVASAIVVHTMYDGFMRQSISARGSDRLLQLAAMAHREVLCGGDNHPMGSTMVSVLIQQWNMWLLAVGDSRVYLYRNGGLLLLNRPHIYGKDSEEAQALYGTGAAIDECKASALSSYIGQEKLRSIDRTIQPIRLISGDCILLMSDGVFSTLSESEMLDLLAAGTEDIARALISNVEAKHKPGQDNATALVIQVE